MPNQAQNPNGKKESVRYLSIWILIFGFVNDWARPLELWTLVLLGI
jgi:hypothetical protein